MSDDSSLSEDATREHGAHGERRRTLIELGWRGEVASGPDGVPIPDEALARVSEIHRDSLRALTVLGDVTLTLPPALPIGDCAVGDWVRIDPIDERVVARLERHTVLRRQSAGERSDDQVIAANIDTLLIVSSCNADFNPARLERYLALAASADILPVVILTKADLTEDAASFRRTAQRLSPVVTVLTLDARDGEALEGLAPWVRSGETAALVGSSGVGKSTILNGLCGSRAATQGIREDDAKGRHTTTARSLHATRFGGWLIDTPGLRAVGLVDAADGIEQVFGDLVELAAGCRFPDCAHESEPGCAVRAAIESGAVEAERLQRWRKLEREDRHHTRSVAEARAGERRFARQVRSAMSVKRRKRDG